MTSTPTPVPVPAGLDRRFLAFATDRLVQLGPGVASGVVASEAGLSLGASIGVGVGVLLLVWLVLVTLVAVRGTSPGKQLTGLAVVRVDRPGEPVGFGAALRRCVVLALPGILTGGFAWLALAWTALVDGSGMRRGWHDRVAGTAVVDARPATPVEVDVEVAQTPTGVVNLTTLRLVPAAEPATASRTGSGVRSRPVPPPRSALSGEDGPRVPAQAGDEDPAGRTVIRSVQSEPRVPVQHHPTPTWFVAFDGGPEFEVTGLVLIGRNPEPRPGEPVAHLVPLASADMSVSKTHAQVAVASDGVLVALDRGSTNGSVLVRQGISKPLVAGRGTTLRDGDRVRFGDREMRVRRG